MDINRKNWTDSLKSRDAKVVYRVLVQLRGLFKKRAGNFKVDKECFSVILSFLKSSNRLRQSMAISLLGYACLKLNYRILFIRSKSAVQNLLNVLDTCVDDEILCRAWRLTGNLLRPSFVNLEFFNNELKERFQNLLDVEVLKNMHFDTRTCLAMAFKYFWRHGEFSPELFEQLMKLVTSGDIDIMLFTLDLVNSVVDKPPKFELSSETAEALIALTKHSEQKISHTAVSILVKKYAQESISKIDESFRIAFAYVDDLTLNPRALSDVTMKVMATFTRESNVRNKLKHSCLLKAVLHYGIEKKMTEVITILNNYQYDQDVINVCANDGTIVKHLIAMVPTDSSIEIILQGLARSPLIHQEIASVKSLKTLLGFRKCWPVLRAIVGSEKHTKEILLSGLCWALEKAGCVFDTKINTYHTFNIIKNFNLMAKPENCHNISLSFPFIVERGNYTIMGEYLKEMHGLSLLLSALEATPTDDGTAHAVFKLCEWFSLSNHKEFKTDSYRMHLILNAYSGQLGRLDACEWKPWNFGGLQGEMVTIIVNDGMRVRWDRNQLSEMSPVFSAMLNGSFIEAGQDCVQFANCSAAGLSALLKMMTSESDLNKIPVDVRLEMLELADRLLIPKIDQVIACSIETSVNCLNLYPWVREKGYLLDSFGARFINASGYFHTFRNADCFLLLLRNQSTQKLLIEDVKEYLHNCYNDMLPI